MFKLMHKKLNKKGFTLAELLIVVAIIAILVAIAIPVFSQAMKKAQIRTNDANIRSTKAAAITEILDEWDTFKIGSKDNKGKGWWAIGHVTAEGKLDKVDVYISNNAPSKPGPAVGFTNGSPTIPTKQTDGSRNFPSIGSPTNSANAWIQQGDSDLYSTASPSGNGYYTLVYIDDVSDVSKTNA